LPQQIAAASIASVSDTPGLGPIPERLTVTSAQVARLIRTQFPQWAELPIREVATPGWDNRTFHLGDELSVRLPSAEAYALAVDKEHRWLPVLGPQLPLPIPEPIALGRPDADYPYRWSVYPWLPGEPATADNIADLTAFAIALADFLVALQAIDGAEAPGPGLHNWYRGGPLTRFATEVERDLATLTGHLDVATVKDIWQEGLAAGWDGEPVWFHGDVAGGNLLVRDGTLAAVIDFGTCGVGDPACDLAVAWTLLSGPSRTAFRERLGADDATWARGRGWALWKALAGVAYGVGSGSEPVDSLRVLNEILADDQGQ
jgi:aminoglycoside phosphotransferase (APT) family kinase protein